MNGCDDGRLPVAFINPKAGPSKFAPGVPNTPDGPLFPPELNSPLSPDVEIPALALGSEATTAPRGFWYAQLPPTEYDPEGMFPTSVLPFSIVLSLSMVGVNVPLPRWKRSAVKTSELSEFTVLRLDNVILRVVPLKSKTALPANPPELAEYVTGVV